VLALPAALTVLCFLLAGSLARVGEAVGLRPEGGLMAGQRLVMGAAAWIALAWTLGGLWLLQQRVIQWQVPAGVLAGVLALALPLWLYDAGSHGSPWFHLSHGALALGAFFIATDPVSGAATPRGRLVFGFGVGALAVLVRTFGAWPDGVAFGVLLMNAVAPLLDRALRPRVFGRPR
jgi:electron transport complex protein RnfD